MRDYLHPFYHLERVWTYRSSSSHINFQNQPVRFPFIKKLVRQAVIPRPGHMIVEIDYSGVEVRIAATYHKDPNMMEEINNPERDMHRDMAQACYKLGDDEWTRETRYCGKNKFVFPQFYGDYFVSCAKSLWEAIDHLNLKTRQGISLKKHLKKKGIASYSRFENHIERVEHDFWNKKFEVYGKWKEDHFRRYEEKGYVEFHTGFICRGYMKKNQVINCPVQGVAFHCLLKSFIELVNWMEKTNKRSKAIGQVHDSMVLDVHVDEFYRVVEKARYIMTKKILKDWPWINVPLDIEIESTPVNGSWYLKQEVYKKKCECGFRYQFRKEGGETIIWTCPACGNVREV